jgi:hypothetical protein
MVLHIGVCGANTFLNGAIIARLSLSPSTIAKGFMALQLLIFLLKEQAGC